MGACSKLLVRFLNQMLMHYRASKNTTQVSPASLITSVCLSGATKWPQSGQNLSRLLDNWGPPPLSRAIDHAGTPATSGKSQPLMECKCPLISHGQVQHRHTEKPPDAPPPPLPPEPKPLWAPQGPKTQAVVAEDRPVRARIRPAHLDEYITSFHT